MTSAFLRTLSLSAPRNWVAKNGPKRRSRSSANWLLPLIAWRTRGQGRGRRRSRLAPQAVEVERRIRGGPGPLRTPQGLPQALEQRVLGLVLVAACAQALVFGANARRLIDRQLFLDCQMQV